MRLLADENVPRIAAVALREMGHDVRWVGAETPGLNDAEVLGWAVRERRILLTFDRDFGALSRETVFPAGCGIILFRLGTRKPAEIARHVCAAVAARDDWADHFSVVETGRVRMRPLSKMRPLGKK
jgi:predicted nuclease of predicted toxin-antitoxin system